mgnify:CR=1 FL=1
MVVKAYKLTNNQTLNNMDSLIYLTLLYSVFVSDVLNDSIYSEKNQYIIDNYGALDLSFVDRIRMDKFDVVCYYPTIDKKIPTNLVEAVSLDDFNNSYRVFENDSTKKATSIYDYLSIDYRQFYNWKKKQYYIVDTDFIKTKLVDAINDVYYQLIYEASRVNALCDVINEIVTTNDTQILKKREYLIEEYANKFDLYCRDKATKLYASKE